MRTKVGFRSAGRENYNDFCEKNKDVQLSFSEWKEIIYMYSDLFRKQILDTGRMMKLPMGVGEFSINKKIRKKFVKFDGKERINLPIDWKKTKERGKKVYSFNHHTEGYSFSWLWVKKNSRIMFSTLWYFKANRKTSRLLAKYLNSEQNYHHKYCEWFK